MSSIKSELNEGALHHLRWNFRRGKNVRSPTKHDRYTNNTPLNHIFFLDVVNVRNLATAVSVLTYTFF